MAGQGLPYHLIHHGGRSGWWRPILGVFVLIVAFVVMVPVVVQVPFAIGFALTGRDVSDGLAEIIDFDDPTPLGLAYLNISLACAILVAWLINRVLHGLRPGWLASVLPRIRWRWLVLCFGLSFLALLATLVVSSFMPNQGEGTEMSGQLNDFTTTTRNFALVVLFLTPLQAAGEEYAFRGYLTQAFGGLFAREWAAVLFPATLFAIAHGSQDAPIFFDRFAFGIVAGLLVVRTGGLEAGIAMHVLNNWLAFGMALAFGDMASSLNPTGGTWWSIPVTLTQSLAYLFLVLWFVRRRGLRTTTSTPAERGVLVGQNDAV